MKTIILLFFLSAISVKIYAQRNKSLPDSIRKYFNYDTLHYLNCKDVPLGIYSLSFKVDKNKSLLDVQFSGDSLFVLKNLLIAATKNAIKDFHFDKQKKYLLLIYYNNYFGCNNDDTSGIEVQNVESEGNKLLSKMLVQVDKSFTKIIAIDDEYVVLRTVEITNTNPNKPKPKSFVNDSKTSSEKEMPADRLKHIKEEVERKRKGKSD